MTKEIILAVIVLASIGALVWAFMRSGKNSTSNSTSDAASTSGSRARAAAAATIITAGTVSPMSASILAASVARKEKDSK